MASHGYVGGKIHHGDESSSAPGKRIHGQPDRYSLYDAIQGAVSPMSQLMCPVTDWTPEAVNEAGLTVAAFLKLAKIITAITDKEQLSKLYSKAVTLNVVPLPMELTVPQFIGFCGWARKPVASETLQSVQSEQKLRRKAMPGQALSSVATTQILDIQLQEYRSHNKECMDMHEKKITDLRRQIGLAERERDSALTKLDAEFLPAAAFEEPSIAPLGKRSWELHSKDAAEKGKPTLAKNNAGKMLGNVARAKAMAKRNLSVQAEYK